MLLYGNHLEKLSIVWPNSTRTLNLDDIEVGNYFMATTYIHKMSHLLSGLKVLVL